MMLLHVKTNQAYLITAGFLHKHSYDTMSAKFCCCITKSLSTSGGLPSPDPLIRGFAPGLHWGHSTQTLTKAPLPFQKYFWHYLWHKLCTPVKFTLPANKVAKQHIVFSLSVCVSVAVYVCLSVPQSVCTKVEIIYAVKFCSNRWILLAKPAVHTVLSILVLIFSVTLLTSSGYRTTWFGVYHSVLTDCTTNRLMIFMPHEGIILTLMIKPDTSSLVIEPPLSFIGFCFKRNV